MSGPITAKRDRDVGDDLSGSSPHKRMKKPPCELVHDDYTVGWLCVLPNELYAARAMLDEKHDPLPQVENDDNSYILGRMGQHNVVITFTGAGSYGKSAATQVTTNMIRTFRNIRFGLLVGVGGGAPKRPHLTDPLQDVRLGDVVIGTAKGSHGGIFHSDRGKWKGEEIFHVESHLNKPPKILSKAIELLQCDIDFGDDEMRRNLQHAIKGGPLKNAAFPGRDKDQLFSSDCDHSGQEDCSDCSTSELVERLDRESDDPAIHYGLIASSDAVVRSAKLRDRLRDTYDVMCFEMEAAGVVDDFPCAVIKGICDYSDEHKNKLWQPYSALVAAAYAKDLLRVIQPQQIQAMEAVASMLESVTQELKAIRSDSKTGKILQWLTPIDYGLQQSHAIKIRTPGTGQWLLKSTHYESWLGSEGGTLFCPGIPGAGKTILASVVINDLTNRFTSNAAVGIAYAYYNYQRQDEQKPEDLLASLLKQLIPNTSASAETIGPLYEKHKNNNTRPALDELMKTSQSVFSSYEQVFVIVDALDEIQPHESGREKILSALSHLQSMYKINIFATSRSLPDVTKRFEVNQTLEIRATTEDIQAYINAHMHQVSTVIRHKPALQVEVAVGIADAVDGMFLLAKIYLESLSDKTSPKAVKNAIMQFRKQARGSTETQKRDVLELAYKDVMERVNLQQPGHRQLAIGVLSWVFFAQRPLTTLQLQHALAVEIGSNKFDPGNLTAIDVIIQVCAGLVTINKRYMNPMPSIETFEFVHYTTQEYFEKTQMYWFPRAQDDITTTCISYLSFEVFESGCCQEYVDYYQRLQSYPLYKYAATNWGDHAREAGSRLASVILDFLVQENHVSASSQVLESTEGLDYISDWTSSSGMSGIHLAAYFGLSDLVSHLIQDGHSVHNKDKQGRTPLLWAAKRGHADVVGLLLAESQVDINSRDEFGRTALSLAAESGHEMVVIPRNPRRHGFEVNFSGHNDYFPIASTVKNGYSAIIGLLLTRKEIDANAKDLWGRTALHLTIAYGDDATAKALLDSRSLDPNMRDRDGLTPLMLAVEAGQGAIVTLLLEREDIDVTCHGPQGQPLLYFARKNENQMFVRLCLAKMGVDADSTDTDDGRTVLSWVTDFARLGHWGVWTRMASTTRGHPFLTRVLMEMEHLYGQIYEKPLIWAATHDHAAIIEELQRRGISTQVNSQFRRLALFAAIQKGYGRVVQVLLRDCPNLEVRDLLGRTPLILAAEEGHEDIVQCLLESGAIASAKDFKHRTPMSLALEKGYEGIAQQLSDIVVGVEAE